jgi:hypothetical protein
MDGRVTIFSEGIVEEGNVIGDRQWSKYNFYKGILEE